MTGYTLYLAEKPDVANDIASAIGMIKKQNGYFECKNNVVVSWCFGHMFEAKDPQDYNPEFKEWRWDTLPIIPKNYGFKKKKSTSRQVDVLKKLFNNAGSLVIATDSDREGEYIAYEVILWLKWKGHTERLWLNDMNKNAILKAIKNIRPARETKPLFHAAYARARADWLVGMNMTRAATLRMQQLGMVSIGRVQTPVLRLIVDRHLAIQNFKPEDYFDFSIDVKTQQGHQITLKCTPPEAKRIKDRKKAEEIQKKTEGANGPLHVKTELKSEKPKTLHDMAELQSDANKKWGWSAAKTLKIAQALYEQHKLLTYPRTDAKVLPEEHKSEAPDILAHLVTHPKWSAFSHIATSPCLEKHAYDDSKVTAHYAIVPTSKKADFNDITVEERNLYELVASKFLAAHMPDYEYNLTTIAFKANGIPFKTSGSVPVKPGWKEVYAREPKDKNEDDQDEEGEDDAGNLPPIKDQEPGRVMKSNILAKKTKPPKPFTEASLIGAMQKVAEYVEDKDAKKRLKETSGIGTNATRAGIIETLKARKYITTKKRKIIPEDKGIYVIEAMKSVAPEWTDPAETATWEDSLHEIADINNDYNLKTKEFLSGIENKLRTDIITLRDTADLKDIPNDPNAPPRITKEQRQDAMDNGIILEVSYDKTKEVKKLGAVWHPEIKKWLRPPHLEKDIFEKAGFQDSATTIAKAKEQSTQAPSFDRKTALKSGIPLKVPFESKQEAKSLGALWHNDKKTWICPPHVDVGIFRDKGWVE